MKSRNEQIQEAETNKNINSFYGHHIPTGEDWLILGISKSRNRVCVAGFPPTMAYLTDIAGLTEGDPLSEKELKYRESTFGYNWD